MDIRVLKYFVQVAKSRNFTRAAEQLYISQPALSKMIKKLEAELFAFADRLDKAGITFMLSYVIEHKGAVNRELLAWVERKNYRVIRLGDIIGISGSRRKEVLILNYGRPNDTALCDQEPDE